ncbi:hypothetical protein VTL71DRAFT_10307 [Oculimacula yallundae]|uniref:2EXR domain-containing protein n=1 Tax=Oculimacula yallundae TaxID=86028 RepID=A0ABR4CUD5_9HELO
MATPASAPAPAPASARASPAASQLRNSYPSHWQFTGNSESYHSTFTLFGQLPIELRLSIWNFSRPDSWTLHLCHRRSGRTFITTEVHSDSRREAVPEILHVNQESRTLALKLYEVVHAGWVGKPVYFDSARDAFNVEAVCHLDTILIDSGIMQVPWAHILEPAPPKVEIVDWPAKLRHIQFITFPLLEFGYLQKFSALENIVVSDHYNPAEYVPYKQKFREVPLYGYLEANLLTVVKAWTGYESGLWTGSKDKLPLLTIYPGGPTSA